MEKLWQSATELGVTYGGQIITALVVLVLGWTFAGWIGALCRKGLVRAGVDETLARFLSKLSRWGVLLLVVLGCLSIFGVETTSFAAVIGSAGIAIGLAFQGTLSNFASGIMLLMFRPFDVGDVIAVAGQVGKVNEISLFTTEVDTFDNRRIIIPNAQVFGSTIENITHHSQRRADVAVGVSYSADIDRTRDVLNEAARAVPGVLQEPEPAVILLDLGDSAVNWSVRVWAPAEEFGAVKQAATRAVKIALDEAAIEIPFPQMDVNLTSSEP